MAILGQKHHRTLLSLLKRRGFLPRTSTSLQPPSQGLLIQLAPNGTITFLHPKKKQSFQLSPKQKKSAKVRAMLIFLDIFLEEIAAPAAPPSKKTMRAPGRNPVVPPLRPRPRPRPARVALLPRPQPRPIVVPEKVPSPVLRLPTPFPSPKPPPPRPRSAQKPIAASPAMRIASLWEARPRAEVSLAPILPPPSPLWFALELAGSLSLQDVQKLPLGGYTRFVVGFHRWRFSLGSSLHRFLQSDQPQTTLLRPDLSLGFAFLLRPIAWDVSLGTCAELLWLSAGDKTAFRARFGPSLASSVRLPLREHLHLLLRSSFALFFQDFRFALRGEPLYQASLWRLDVHLGLHLRF